MMQFSDKLRLSLAKKQFEDNQIKIFEGVSDEKLLQIMDLLVVPNSVDINTVKSTNFFHFIFSEKNDRKEKLIKDINDIINMTLNLSKTEKMIIKFGLLKGFTSNVPKVEFYRYLQEPLSIRSQRDGRKFMAFRNFREIFYFIYNVVTKGRKNGRLPTIR